MSDKTAEKPKPREDGSYAEPAFPGKWWCEKSDGRAAVFIAEERGGRLWLRHCYVKECHGEPAAAMSFRDTEKWFPFTVPGLDEPRPEGERWEVRQWHETAEKFNAAKVPYAKHGGLPQRAAELIAERDALQNALVRMKEAIGASDDPNPVTINVDLLHRLLDEYGYPPHEDGYAARLSALASERDAALARAEKAERERDEAKAKLSIIASEAEGCGFFINGDVEENVGRLCDQFKWLQNALRESITAQQYEAFRREHEALKAELSSLKASASRPVLPEGVDERQLRAACERALRSPGAASIWSSEAKGILALLDAFTSPPPETETGEAEREDRDPLKPGTRLLCDFTNLMLDDEPAAKEFLTLASLAMRLRFALLAREARP